MTVGSIKPCNRKTTSKHSSECEFDVVEKQIILPVAQAELTKGIGSVYNKQLLFFLFIGLKIIAWI